MAFALEVEGYSTESYDSVQKAEVSCRQALCAIFDDGILRSESQAATQFLRNLSGRAIVLVDGLSAVQRGAGFTTLVKPFTGADLFGVINSRTEAAK